MRIDFVITELFVGGAERCLTELAIGCARCGDQVRVASIGSLPGKQQSKFVDRLRTAGVELVSTNCDRPWQFLGARALLRDWMQANPPDIVQTMLFHANVMGVAAALAAGVKTCVGGVRVAEKSTVRSFIEALAMKRMAAVVCVSDSVREFVIHTHHTTTPLYVVGNAVDLEQVGETTVVTWNQLDSQHGPIGDQVLLFVGRLHSQKGLDVLFKALPKLLQRHQDMQVVIVGDGPLRNWAEAKAKTTGGSRVAVIGWREDVRALINGCRLLVLPSRYEGMPNVVMEAMAASKPVAVTMVEGVNDLLREGAEDQTCPVNDATALGALIDRLWSDAARATLIGQRNREVVAAHHSTAAMVDSYRNLYRSLLEAPLR